ncbi:ATP synthase protein I [Listeria fleischmannii FSL S10-1203]|uniref:ATP synthase protein I n=1 Tax=Listeria fleischmannii FSL S10-1203 TaxID=1265822 RepID=W7DYE0_9LIST|nr:ATP synthase protein I [Listeria fleischmannii FSL S10-1203]
MLESLIGMYHRHQKYLVTFIALCLIGWFLTPYVHIFLGLKLGLIVGWFNYWLLMRRTQAMTKALAENRSFYGMGTTARMGSMVLATIIATQIPEYFHIYSVIIGLGIAYAVYLFRFHTLFLISEKKKVNKKRGVNQIGRKLSRGPFLRIRFQFI